MSAAWAVLDWRGILYTEWSWMGCLVGGSALVGAIAGALIRVSATGLAASIDRRAGLEDRLATAGERIGTSDPFDDVLRADAEAKLALLKPNRVFPIRVGRWQGSAVMLSAAAAAIFLLGNTPIGLSEDERHTREDLKKQGQAVERITKRTFETPEAKEEMSESEKKLADELRKYQRDLEKARMTKEEALQKANDLTEKANELERDSEKNVHQDLEQAQSVQQQLEKGELEKAGLGNVSPQMAKMPDGERQQKLAQAKKEASDIQKQLDALKSKLEELNKKLANPNLSAKERKELEDQKSAAEKAQAKLKNDLQANKNQQKALALSKEAQEIFEKMMKDPLYKELLEIQKKLAQQAGQPGEAPPQLTDAERKEMQEKLEQLAQKLKDPTAMKEYLEALIKAAKEGRKAGRCKNIGFGLNGTPLSMSGNNSMTSGQTQAPPGPGAPTEDIWHGDSGQVYKLDKPAESQGKTTTNVISGQQREGSGPAAYVEIKAPTTVGNRSAVPYQNVLPSYKKKAESALNRQQIPKQHQQRVKEYFQSLTGSGKG